MKDSEKFFSSDYFTAKQRFCERTKDAGGRLEALPVDVKGPNGEPLSIDIAWFGAEKPRAALLHSSGVHGVEGFAGSAIQLQLLNALPRLARDVALIIVHVLNPYGMAWLRRFNENNVDLNRNFLSVEDSADVSKRLRIALEAYSKFDSFLNPQSPPAVDFYLARAVSLVLRYGMPILKQSVVAGQYWFPQGLFFGGKILPGGFVEMEPGPAKYQTFLTQHLSSTERIIAIDVHTGLGKYGEDSLLVGQEDYGVMRQRFGDRVRSNDPKTGPAYDAFGTLESMLPRAMPKAEILNVTQEFGTFGPMKVLHALREENRWHHYGAGLLDHPAKQRIKETFYPQDNAWEASVLNRGAELLKRGLSQL